MELQAEVTLGIQVADAFHDLLQALVVVGVLALFRFRGELHLLPRHERAGEEDVAHP